MKNSLSHLPQVKQNELQKIVLAIRESCDDVEKIILFGSYARGNYKEEKDLKPERKSGHVSDYDILVVTAKKEVALDVSLWNKISAECGKLNLSASPRIITHDIEALNIKLAECQYFFSDIKKEGIALFDSEKFKFADERNLTLQEKRRIAQNHFEEWFGRAAGFFNVFEFLSKQDGSKTILKNDSNPYAQVINNGLAAFNLHQSAESAYKAVLLVFSNYSPREHFLQFLGEKAEQYSSLMKNIFAKISKEDEERFKLLEYAYIGGRYDPQYRISKEDLEILAQNVKNLLQLTEEICKEKIKSF
jgi:predicted nucleotidyltransferase/HEPN domain-containing protein